MKVIYYLYEQGNQPSAAWGRVRLIVRGLQANGVNADVVSIKSPYGLNRLLRPFILFKQAIRLYFQLFLDDNNKIVCYGYNYTWFLFFFPRRAKLFVERTEYPDYLIRNAPRNRLLEDTPLKKIDGFITCTRSLESYYSGLCRANCPFFVLPVIVDSESFYSEIKESANKITYCGDWGNNKDGVDILIKAFSLFDKKHPGYILELIGGSTKQVEDGLKELAKQLGLNKKVDFVGRVPHDLMASHLITASILALARPNNKQAEGGFPCKVAEYLSTGVPVVLTRVGDLPIYLKDNDNCYMAEPDSAEAFSEKMCEAIENPNSILVGGKGRELAQSFNYTIQSKLLLDFLVSVK